MKRPCIDCGTPAPRTRCPTCTTAHNRIKAARRPDMQDPAERKRRAATVQQWRTQYGDWCPGWNRPGHHTTDLTADHITDIALGGHPHGPLTVLCRSCNGAKGQATRHP